MAMNKAIGEARYVKAVLKEMQVEGAVDISIMVYTYSKNLQKLAYTSVLVLAIFNESM